MNSNNKYGLDFRVWGYKETEKKKDTTPDILKSIGHGWGESSKPKKQKEVVEYTEERIEPKKEQITCILKNARFLPDENTDFGKRCKIRVEIEGESHRLVHLYLWAVYNGEEHDLRHEVEANHNQGICETEMPLFYVEPYHNDVFKNGKKDAKVEYFAKIKMHGAKEIRSELMVMPRPPAVLNINEIDGPGSLAHDTKGVYVVKSFNREATQEEKDSLSWAVKINGKEIERFENVGDSFEYTPCAKYAGETITVHPFLRSPSDNLFIKTTIGQYLLYNGSELIWLDESHKEVGKWKACSNTDTTDPAKENGPLPEGNWVILQDARDQNPDENWWKNLTGKKDPVIWADKNRVELVPFKETDTQGRVEKFYLSGGEGENSSLRGINLAGDIDNFVDKFQKSGKNLVLTARYESKEFPNKDNGFEAFCNAVGNRESGNNYKAVNQYGFLGKYQFGMARLMDLTKMVSRIDPSSKGSANHLFKWNEGYSCKYFLEHPEIQEQVFKKHTQQYIRWAKMKFAQHINTKKVLEKTYFSKAVNRKISEVIITISGIVGGAHLKGFGGIEKFILKGIDGTDANGTHISEYIFLFGGYDLSEAEK